MVWALSLNEADLSKRWQLQGGSRTQAAAAAASAGVALCFCAAGPVQPLGRTGLHRVNVSLSAAKLSAEDQLLRYYRDAFAHWRRQIVRFEGTWWQQLVRPVHSAHWAGPGWAQMDRIGHDCPLSIAQFQLTHRHDSHCCADECPGWF